MLSAFNIAHCYQCVFQTRDTFTAQSMVRYEMLGTPDDFMIVSAVAESMYTFVPMTEGRGKIMTFAK